MSANKVYRRNSKVTTIVQIDSPYLTPKEFAKRIGLTESAVRQRASKGEYPLKPRKTENDKIFINVALMTARALENK